MDNPETLTTIKNGQSRDTDNNQELIIQRHWQQSRMDNPEKLTAQWYNWCLCIILFYSGMSDGGYECCFVNSMGQGIQSF
jgi:hypothetical protein